MYDRKGNLIYSEELDEKVNPKLDMITDYIENIGNKEYLKNHIMHHKEMIEVITKIYNKARKVA